MPAPFPWNTASVAVHPWPLYSPAVSQNPFETGGPSPWEAPGAPIGQPPPNTEPGIPWENAQTGQTLLDTLKGVLLDPARTFAQARRGVGIGPAVLYALMLGTIGGTAGVLWSYLTQGLLGSQSAALPEELSFLTSLSEPGLGQLLMVPIGAIVGLFIWGGIVHAVLAMLGAAGGGFESTLRCIAFSNGSVAVLQLVPVAGGMIAGVWGLVIQIMALKELHQTTSGKAVLAVLLPLGLCCCGVFAAIGIGAGIFASTLAK